MLEENLHNLLVEATQGLLFPSETDARIVPFVLPLTNHVRQIHRVQGLIGIEPNRPLEQITVTRFFRPVIDPGLGRDPEETARFRWLLKVLKANLHNLKVWRVGKIDIEVYVVGRSALGNLAGLRTRVVET